MPAPREEAADAALARFLGFDPEAGLASLQLPDEPAPRIVQLPVAPPEVRDTGAETLEAALRARPRQVLLAALAEIMREGSPNDEPVKQAKGRYGMVRSAANWALQELAHMPEFRSEVAMSGWIIGKRADPHR